jgi:hypothetical protein
MICVTDPDFDPALSPCPPTQNLLIELGERKSKGWIRIHLRIAPLRFRETPIQFRKSDSRSLAAGIRKNACPFCGLVHIAGLESGTPESMGESADFGADWKRLA